MTNAGDGGRIHGRGERVAGNVYGRLSRLGQAEVEQFCSALGEHDVAGLQIAMNDAAAMSLVESVGDFDPDFKGLAKRQGAATQSRGESLALEVFHHQVFGAVLMSDVVESADVRMVER